MSQQRANKRSGRPNDFQTDKEGVRPLLKYIPKHWKIWECACGKGQIVDFLAAEGYTVVATDIIGGFDFLSPLAAQQADYDAIITNPPYDIKDEWILRCLELGKPFALLLPITFFDSKERRRMFKKHGMKMLLPDGRVIFTTPNGKKGGSWFYCAWFCFGIDLPEQITFAD